MRCFPSLICTLALVLAACQRLQAQVEQLPSGHEIRVVSIGIITFSADKPAWLLKYETKTSFDNVPELRKEALELWERYQSMVEQAGREGAVLSANEPRPNTVFAKTRGYNFIVQKQPDGTWKMLE